MAQEMPFHQKKGAQDLSKFTSGLRILSQVKQKNRGNQRKMTGSMELQFQ
jgi:hypothetical protein